MIIINNSSDKNNLILHHILSTFVNEQKNHLKKTVYALHLIW